MTLLDQLSDVTYRDRAREAVERFLADHPIEDKRDVPVKRTQIYGLRQIAIQQPLEVASFAKHQRERAEKKEETASQNAKPKLQAEIEFWKLVAGLCEGQDSEWSVEAEGRKHLPAELQDANIPNKQKGMSHEERSRRKQLTSEQGARLDQWKREHIPEFFRRFCTHYLYCIRNYKD